MTIKKFNIVPILFCVVAATSVWMALSLISVEPGIFKNYYQASNSQYYTFLGIIVLSAIVTAISHYYVHFAAKESSILNNYTVSANYALLFTNVVGFITYTIFL